MHAPLMCSETDAGMCAPLPLYFENIYPNISSDLLNNALLRGVRIRLDLNIEARSSVH